MKIALVDGCKKPKRYPFGLMKIARYLKNSGHEVVFCGNHGPSVIVDQTWISAIFTYDIPFVLELAQQCRLFTLGSIRIGGVSPTLMPQDFTDYEVHTGLLPEAQGLAPDYSILPEKPQYSITQTSYGCIRKCEFCAVRMLEPNFTVRDDWEKDVSPATCKLLIYDNNWTAKPYADKRRDIEKLKAMQHLKEIDFNQALDCRIYTERDADLMQQIRVKPLRFAYDGLYEDGYIQRALDMSIARGIKNYCIYVLFNFTDTPQDFYYRLRELTLIQEKSWGKVPSLHITAFPMMYRPVFEIGPYYVETGNYTAAQCHAIKTLSAMCGFGWGFTWVKGLLGTPLKNFEYWIGRDVNEFMEIINQEHIASYLRIKYRKALDNRVK